MVYDPTKPSRLHDTEVFLAGTKVDLADQETIKWLKAEKIETVFCLFPITESQFEALAKDAKREAADLNEFYRWWGIQPGFVEKLRKNGITVSSLVRSPKQLRGDETFPRKAVRARRRGNFLIQCFAGKHVSAAYAMYYFAVATPKTLSQIREIFIKSGRGKDLARIEGCLRAAGISIQKVIENKLKKVRKRIRRKELQKKRRKRRGIR